MAEKTKTVLQIIVLAGLLLTTGCNKLTMENYDQLRVGMTYDEVVALLGAPDDCSEALGARSCAWGDESRNIQVIFLGGTATLFSHAGLK